MDKLQYSFVNIFEPAALSVSQLTDSQLTLNLLRKKEVYDILNVNKYHFKRIIE